MMDLTLQQKDVFLDRLQMLNMRIMNRTGSNPNQTVLKLFDIHTNGAGARFV